MNRFREAFGDWTPRAVVFDCDGILLDTESVWQRTLDAVVAARGVPLTADDELELHGSTIEDAARIVARRAGGGEGDVLTALRDGFGRELADGVRPMPGATEVVAAAAAKVPLACASNSWLAALEDKLTRGGLREHLTALEASDTVERSKPAPDMYLAGARALGADPADALAFEDSGTGARAARDAGLRLIVVPSTGGPAPAGDLVLDSLADPDLREWIATW